MQHARRGVLLVGILSVAAGAACSTYRRAPPQTSLSPPLTQVRVHDHLAFGVRLERVSLWLDGAPAYEVDSIQAPLEPTALTLAPGGHTLAVMAEASEPCGLFEEPRMRVSVRAVESFFVGDGPAALDVDLYPNAATSDAAHMVSIRFAGDRVVLGAKLSDDSPPRDARCESGDEVCALDARIDGARARGDFRQGACYANHRDEMRRWRDLLEDSFAAVSREGATTRDAETAQLRARYAESRLHASIAEAQACADVAPRQVAAVKIERKVVAACAAPDVTARSQDW